MVMMVIQESMVGYGYGYITIITIKTIKNHNHYNHNHRNHRNLVMVISNSDNRTQKRTSYSRNQLFSDLQSLKLVLKSNSDRFKELFTTNDSLKKV